MSANRGLRWALAGLAVVAALVLVMRGSRKQSAPHVVAPPDTRQICAQRLAEIGQALRAYAEDYDGHFPVTPSPAQADVRLRPLLGDHGLQRDDFRCPAREYYPYVYHCYHSLGPGPWPNWMLKKHFATLKSPPSTWLMADYLERDKPGPHSQTEKALNYLCVDGRVRFHAGRPREVYK